jgi:hypothetical protein
MLLNALTEYRTQYTPCNPSETVTEVAHQNPASLASYKRYLPLLSRNVPWIGKRQ